MDSKATQSNHTPPKNKESNCNKLIKFGHQPEDKQTKPAHSTISITTILFTKKPMLKIQSRKITILNMLSEVPIAQLTLKAAQSASLMIRMKPIKRENLTTEKE